MVFEVQTRTTGGELRFWPTLKEAMTHAEQNVLVWKVSFPVGPPENCERCRLVKNGSGSWVYEDIMQPIEKALKNEQNG